MLDRTVPRVLRCVCLAFLLFPAANSFAEEPERKFFFNAYLTQAYGETDSTQVLGLDPDGTFDYRSAALLFRYQPTQNDRFVVQLAHERLGASPFASLLDDVELDWAFYEHRFVSGYKARLGRVPIPFGIYNETRDVGTLLEFYRPPVSIYFEGAYTSESVDGAVLSKTFFEDRPWSLSVDLYGGSWDRPAYLAPTVYEGKAKDAFGAQLWLQTPIEGLRVGLAAQHFEQDGGLIIFGEAKDTDVYLLSFDANFEHLVLRAEGQWIESKLEFVPKLQAVGYYGLTGWRFTENFEVYFSHEHSLTRWNFGTGIPVLEFDPLYKDSAISMIYRFNPKALVRLEAHHFETSSLDVPTPAGQFSPRTEIAILSFSLSY